jgi:hypothetical protein
MVRCFAIWCSATDRRTEVPPVGILPYRYRRQPPYIDTDAEIAALTQALALRIAQRGRMLTAEERAARRPLTAT